MQSFYWRMLLVYAATLFVSATLLFLVQPMVGAMILPLLGGTPAVWNTCMVFFQAMLLAGYAYAHFSTAWLGPRRQAVLHILMLLLPILVLPIAVNKNLAPQGLENPIYGVFGLLLLSVGLPFFVVSASAPLLQKWFADTDHPAAKDPYFLYGASNLGSMLALISYPLYFEPHWKLAEQAWLWGIAYGALAVLTIVCGFFLWFAPKRSTMEQTEGLFAKERAAGLEANTLEHGPSRPAARTRLYWIALAFVPSSLMLGVTTHITTDIAAIPLIWVVPLGLYLLSFILVFSRLPWQVHFAFRVALPILILVQVFMSLSQLMSGVFFGEILLHLTTLFVVCMVCHGELARSRPSTDHLTGYYLLMSLGGVLGGLFNSLLAPLLFTSVMEYPLALIGACLLMPYVGSSQRSTMTFVADVTLLVVMGLLAAGILLMTVQYEKLDVRPLLAPSWFKNSCVVAVGLLAALAYALLGKGRRRDRYLDVAMAAVVGLLLVAHIWGVQHAISFARWIPASLPKYEVRRLIALGLVVFGLPTLLCLFFIRRPIQFGLCMAALLLVGGVRGLLIGGVRYELERKVLHQERDFFGVLAIDQNEDGQHYLLHGRINHGVQQYELFPEITAEIFAPLAACQPADAAWSSLLRYQLWHQERAEARQTPIAYFHRKTPIGQLFNSFRGDRRQKNIAILGLGSGGLSAFTKKGQKLTYFEIDPAVKRIAEDSRYFTYLQDTVKRGVDLKIIMGDGRLQIEKVAFEREEDKYDLIIFDAFTSDAIPVHLVTSDALKIYLSKLTPDGIVVFHISNRYVNLEPVLAKLRDDAGLVGFIQQDDEGLPKGEKYTTTWVIMARRAEAFGELAYDKRWTDRPLLSREGDKLWTDDFHNLMGAFKLKD